MKKSLIKGLIAILIVFIFGLTAVGCEYIDKIINKDDNVNIDDNIDNGGENIDDVAVDKTALNAELALEVTAKDDYLADSFNAYAEKLAAAKAVAGDDEATQDRVDAAASALTEARLALILKPIVELDGAAKEFVLLEGESIEIALADYVKAEGISNITYVIKRSNAVVDVSPIVDGKFTVTAGGVRKATPLTVSIVVCYDGAEKLSVDLSILISNDVAPTLKNEEILKEYDMAAGNGDSVVIDFADNVNNDSGLELNYSVKHNGEELTLDGSCYTFVFGSYTVETVYESFDVTVSATANGREYVLEYTYKLALRDTGKYNVINGSFENGLEGWIFNNTLGEAPFGGIDNKTHFWDQGYPVGNVGSYFSAYADGAAESSQGTLASSYFIVNSEYATYMLSGAGNHNVYITIENKAGEVLALYRNTKFADFPAGDYTDEDRHGMINNTVFLINFVTYKVSLADFMGEEVRFVVHDNASEGWGVVYFDELKTYYAQDEALPENAVLAENLLADKDALKAEIALGVTEQGDYTADSFGAYAEKLAAANSLLGDVAVSQATVDEMTKALSNARLALVVRPVLALDGANKSFKLISGNTKNIALADYVNVNGLSKITYELKTNSWALTLGAIADGSFSITAGAVSEITDAVVSIVVYYDGIEKLTVDLSVQITNDLAPTVFEGEVVEKHDIFDFENKSHITLDLSQNIDNAGNLALSYSVEYGGVKADLDGTLYTFTFGTYADEVVYEIITVTVSYVANGEAQTIRYTYKLAMTDSTAYRLANGGFESGLDGWQVVGNIGGVSSDKTYWVEAIEFGMDGEKMFSAYAPGALESAVGTLTSSPFVVGGSGFVTFKVGAMRDANYVYVDVVDAETKQILARYYNGLWSDADLGGCKLVAYKADLSAFAGKKVFFRISDNADSGYGLFFLDSFNTYYETEPEGFNPATPVSYEIFGTIYDLFNGGFEMGDVQGWWNNGVPGHVTNADAFFSGVAYGKDGNFLYSGVEDFQAGNGLEGNRGVLTSSTFEIGGSGYISFMLGGGGNALCYVQVIDAVTGEILGRYHQQAMQDAVLVKYVADLSAYIGRTARIQVVDQAENSWGCVSFDNVVTYHVSKPEGLDAIDIKGNIKYTIDNGGFESGNLDGWTMNITEAGAHNTLGWVIETEIDAGWYAKNDETKEGRYLLSFAQPGDINCENTKGTLQSSTFSLKQGAFVAFKFGGAGGGSNHDVYVELCRADGSVIARFFNDAEGKVNTRMNAYYYKYEGVEVECFFRVVDNSTGDYGCFVVDDFRVNLESAPEGFIAAIQ